MALTAALRSMSAEQLLYSACKDWSICGPLWWKANNSS